MPGLIHFEMRDLQRQVQPEGWHYHGRLHMRLGDHAIEYPEPVCVNDWLAALVRIYWEVALADHALDPMTFFIDGPEGSPAFEVIRIQDSLRIALLRGDEAVGKCFTPIAGLQAAVEEHLDEVFRQAQSLGDAPVSPALLLQPQCRQFWTGKAGSGAPSEQQLAPSTPAIVCIRADEMAGDPVAGSYRGRCSRCGAEILVAPSSQRMLTLGAQPVCLTCAAADRSAPDLARLENIARLKAKAEAAYDDIYNMHDGPQIAEKVEFALAWLRSAAQLEREAGLTMDADATEKHADHIRTVYRHQFMHPPDPLA
jgi:hypothetical protein